MPRSRYSDSRYTDLFSHTAFVCSLVEHFVHEDFVRELDFSTLKPYKTKFVTRRFLRRECDVIWSVRFRDRTIYLFFLLEFQSSVDHRMPVRLLQYVAEFYASFHRKKSQKYPAIFPVVLYNGRRRWTASRDIANLIDPVLPAAYIPHMTYSLIEERSFSSAILEAMGNITSLLMLAETIPISELALKLEGFAAILKKEDREAVSAFSRWLNDYFAQVSGLPESALPPDLHLEEDPAMLEENLRIYFAQARAEGRDEGVATTKHIIAEQLKATGMKLEDIARITGLDVASLRV